MKSTIFPTNSVPENRISLPTKIISAVISGILLFITAVLFFIVAFQLMYWGRVFPGISIDGIDISGLTTSDAATLIDSQITFDQNGEIALIDGEIEYQFSPKQLGLLFHPAFNADNAYKLGRVGWPWQRINSQLIALKNGINLSPSLSFQGPLAQQQIEKIAQQLNQPTKEAELELVGENIVHQLGQIGRTLDVWATTAFLSGQLMTLENGKVPLVIHSEAPKILDLSSQAETARKILNQDLKLVSPQTGNVVLQLERNQLASIIRFEVADVNGTQSFQVLLDAYQLSQYLQRLSPDFSQNPQNARYIFNDETRQLDLIQPAIIGYELDIEASVAEINHQLSLGNHTVALVYSKNEPEITDNVSAEDLGISELIQTQTTYFYGSSSARIQNIQTAAGQFHGLFVPPGGVFSMSDNIGDISLDSGYAESLIIFGDRTIKGVGGGVCQVSTTLFRTVFFAGFPVMERYSHAYRVYYYELNRSGNQDARFAGLDATLYTPLVDFKFKNDSEYWLLMETYVDPAARSITWKFYSTSDGREVEWDSSGLVNVVNPSEPVYEKNTSLKKGEVKQVDWAVKGADVKITRSVTRNGALLFSDEFSTHYEPWAMVCEYGPKTKGYPPKKIDNDATSCDL